MTLQAVIDLTDQFISYDLDSYLGTGADTSQKVGAINWAIRTVARRAKLFDPAIPITLVAAKSTYDLRSFPSDGRILMMPTTVTIKGAPLQDASRMGIGLWSLSELQRMHPQWMATPAGVPTKAVHIGTKIILHAAPDAPCVAAGSHYVAGTYLPAPMTVGDLAEELDLPIETHECVAYCAASKLASPTITEQAQMARISSYSEDWIRLIEELGAENESTMAFWGTTTPETSGDWMYI